MSDVKSFHSGNLSRFTFLVTGGAGFIGSHIVEYLITSGAGKVIVLDNLSTGNVQNISLFEANNNFEFIRGDISDLPTCRNACRSVDYVFHEAALGSVPRSVENPLATHHANATGFLHMLVAARDEGVKRMVYASSSSVYGDSLEIPKKEDRTGNPLSPYAVSKVSNELYASVFSSLYGYDVIGLRYFNIFGPRQNPTGPYAAAIPLFINAVREQKPPVIFGNGRQTRDFTYVDNAVQANIRAMFTKNKNIIGGVFNVAAGQKISVLALFNTIRKIMKSGIQPLFRKRRSGETMHSLADISRSGKLLGYHPEVFIEEGLKRTIAWLLNNK